jgi:hypothetical protein
MTRKRDTSNVGHILKRECAKKFALTRTHAYFQTECPTLYLRPAFRSSGPSWTGESTPERKESEKWGGRYFCPYWPGGRVVGCVSLLWDR